jgi:hypothetical protein
MTRVTNKNLHATTPKKGSKMTKKRGSKKGQKWPKMGVQKRAKKGSKIEFLRLCKIDNKKKAKRLKSQSHSKSYYQMNI